MVRRVKVFIQLDGAAIGILNLDVTPGIDVDLLDAVCKDVLGEEAVLGHFRIQGIDQLALSHAIHSHTVVLQVSGNAALHLLLGLIAAVGNQSGIGTREVGLHLTEYLCKRHPFVQGSEEEVACLGRHFAFRKDGPAGILLKGDVMHLGLFRL